MRAPFDRPVPLYIVYFLITLLMVSILLSWQAWKRTEDFRQFHVRLAATSVSGAADEIELFFKELKRSLQLFADEHTSLFKALTENPDSEILWAELERLVERHFPEHLGITLTDTSGIPLRPDFDNIVGDVCRTDIHTFINEDYLPQGVIHPNPAGYHFDMMVPWGNREDPDGVFFLSFRANTLAKILERMQTPRHHLMLLNQDQPGLIEVTDMGTRDTLQRERLLTPDETSHIAYSSPVIGTGWELIDLPEPKLFLKETARNWAYTGVMFVVFVVVGLIMLVQIRRNERRRLMAEEQAAQHKANLAHVDRLNTMGEMASGLAHELNQPLSAISTYSQAGLRLMSNPGAQPDKLFHALEQTSLQAKRAGEIIHRMRQFVTKGKTRHAPLEINTVVRRAIGFIQSDLNKKGIKQKFDLGKSLPAVKGDSIQIEQVILNLVHNAIDAMMGCDTQVKEIAVSTRQNESGRIEFSIEDTGPGFDSHVLDKVFDTFYSTKEDGMGLGLSISQSIIEAHGGRLWCDSRPGSGAVCRFTLPPCTH